MNANLDACLRHISNAREDLSDSDARAEPQLKEAEYRARKLGESQNALVAALRKCEAKLAHNIENMRISNSVTIRC
jgi:hypothetical protein